MEIKIANKKIGVDNLVFIVAELGINHNGSLALAKKMMLVAKKAGADAIKLQSFIVDDFVGDKNLMYTYRSQGKEVTESQYKMFKRYELSRKMQKELFAFGRKIGIIVFSTPQDNSYRTVDFLCGKEINMPAIKVGSDDLTNLPMMAYYAKKGKPMIIATGMATLDEVSDAVQAIKKQGNDRIVILKCTSLYPCPTEEVNLSQIKTLQEAFKDCLIGFSDHTQGSTAAVGATMLGAVLIEKHFTLGHNLPGPDQWFSADPAELSFLVKQVREAQKMSGNPELVLSKAEQEMKDIARRSIMAATAINKGQKIKTSDLECKRPGTGLPPKFLPLIIGRKAKKDFAKGYIFQKRDL